MANPKGNGTVWTPVGKGILSQRTGSKLLLEIDLDNDLGPSASGKSRNIATTSGNVRVPGHDSARIGINVYMPNE